MGVRFLHPYWLLALPPVLYLVWRTSRESLAGLNPARSLTATLLRSVIVAALIMAVAGPQTVTRVRELCTMYVLDVSRSVSGDSQAKALEWIKASQDGMRSGDSAGLIVFGSDARVESSPSHGRLPEKSQAVARDAGTDIAAALRLAMASLPDSASRHIVLLSDGNETVGDASAQAHIAQSGGIAIDTVSTGSPKQDEAWVESFSIPSSLKTGEPFEARVVVGANRAQTARLRVYRNGQPVGERTVSLSAGRSVFLIPQKAEKEGSLHYRADLQPGADTEAENNKAYAFAVVTGRPRILLATDDARLDEPLVSALKAARISPEVIRPFQIPETAADYLGIDGLILSNVPATDLSANQMLAIRSAVRQLGVGLIMIGGSQSFGAGGYFKTPVEDALPVRMTIRSQQIVPSLSLLIVVDKSGSMGIEEQGVEKIRIANEAAVACIDAIQPTDELGVIACDSDPKLVAPLRPASQKLSLSRDIRSIRAGGGGIMVYPSLVRAERLLSAQTTAIRHVILLADGSDAEDQAGCLQLAQQMATKKITVSVVAIGDGADVPFLKQLAGAGKGTFYLTQSARNLPKIFTRDTLLASRSLLVEEAFKPVINANQEPVRNLDFQQMPPLLGYVSTTPKATANQALFSHRGDPVLASWQYGLGRSLAFTSDARSRWAAHWLSWPTFPALWAQSVRWVMRRSQSSQWETTMDIENGRAHVRVEASSTDGKSAPDRRLRAHAVLPGGSTADIALEQTARGRYEGSFPATQPGDYIVSVSEQGHGRAQSMASASLAYPEEYRTTQANTPLLRELARTSGGRFNPSPRTVFEKAPRNQRRYTEVWRFFTLIALLLMPLDIAVRRLILSPTEALEVAQKAARLLPRRQPRSAEAPSTSDLLNRKRVRSTDPPAGAGMDISTTSEAQVLVKEDESGGVLSGSSLPESTPAPTRSKLLDAKRRRQQ